MLGQGLAEKQNIAEICMIRIDDIDAIVDKDKAIINRNQLGYRRISLHDHCSHSVQAQAYSDVHKNC